MVMGVAEGVNQASSAASMPDQEAPPAEDRVGAPERHQPPGEGQQVLVGPGPVEPGDLVVLAVGVVVAALGAAQLVAAEQHRHPEGQQQGGQQAPGLPGPELHHLGVAGGAFHPAVPGPVVVGAVPVGLAVGLVVLAVIGDQVAEGEAVVHTVRFTEAVGRRRDPPYRSDEPLKRVANSPTSPPRRRQKSRMVSR
jgi:hypothetical protein